VVRNWDDELKDYATKLIEQGALKLHETPKVVFSNSRNGAQWENATVANGDLAEEGNKLKKQEGRDLSVYGGGLLVSRLIGKNLIDDCHLFINPAVLGGGLPIFNELYSHQNLKLTGARAFSCDIVLMHYQPA
jgi:dihydrofolate reductase